MYLSGNPLPWTNKFKHLGINIGNKIDGCVLDMSVKNAQYCSKNIELNQEFSFAHPFTKVKVNKIYNSHYYGSPLWNLFSAASVQIESSYNRSVKVMLDLPYGTHRSLILQLTIEVHVKILLIRRFLTFMEKIKKSGKAPLVMLMTAAMADCRSTTGSNFRNIMLLVGKTSVYDVKLEDIDKISYFKMEEEDLWKVSTVKEIIEAKAGILEVPGFDLEELEEILNYICTE